jgi:hypothetical protein
MQGLDVRTGKPPFVLLAGPRDRSLRWWLLAAGILLLYTGIYGSLIWRHTALPYFDQANYVDKVYSIAERLDGRPSAWFDPTTYLDAEPAARPPLMMMVPAWLRGARATPRFCGEHWLLMRVLGLALAAWFLARLAGTARIVPALLFTTLASWLYLSLDNLLYLMDPIFASFGLLAFALVCWDMKRLTAGSAALCVASALALVLVKPAGAALELPMLLVLGIVNALWVIRQRRERRDWIGPTLTRAAIFGAFLLAVEGLRESAYGAGVRRLWDWASQGYWDTPRALPAGIASLFPGWLVLLVGGWFLWRVRRGRWAAVDAPPVMDPSCLDTRSAGWCMVCGVATLAWWLVFSVFLTYTFEARVSAAAMPIGVATVLMRVRSSRLLLATATAVSAAVFFLSAGAAAMILPVNPLNFEWPGPSPAARWLFSGPTWFGPLPNPQRPVRELGLIPLMHEVQDVVLESRPPRDTVVVCVCMDDFVEFQSLNLALRCVNAGRRAPLDAETAPWAGMGLSLDQLLLRRRWFLTKAPRNSIALRGDVAADLHAVDALLTKPGSPLRPLLEPVLERTIYQPRYAGDTARTLAGNPLLPERVTLWHLTRAPRPQEVQAALGFVAPLLEGTALSARFHEEEARVADLARNGIGVIAAEQAERIAARADPAFRAVSFEGGLTLLSIGHRRTSDGGLDLDLVWRADEEVSLSGMVAVHFTDAAHAKILGQADYRQDTVPTPVRKGTTWRDRAIVPPRALEGASILALGVLAQPGHMLGVRHPWSDWEVDGVRHRLLVRLGGS